MKLKRMEAQELRLAYETDLVEAFPPEELKPLSAMEDLLSKGLYDSLSFLSDEGKVLGYVLLWRHRDGRYILIDYLCVPVGMRNRGIGAKLLAAIREFYPPETVFILESEAPVGNAEQDAMIHRRLGFYQRCGARLLSYDCALFGVHFKDLVIARSLPEESEIMKKHEEIYRAQFTPERYDRYIQIPLLPGEAIKPVTDWTEDD